MMLLFDGSVDILMVKVDPSSIIWLFSDAQEVDPILLEQQCLVCPSYPVSSLVFSVKIKEF